MQTFLPFADFGRTAAVLDSPRLGKQRVETLQILRAIELPEYGWQNHPAVVMWRGWVPALARYGLDCVLEWTARGFADSTASQISEFAPEVVDRTQRDLDTAGQLPGWLRDERLLISHRSKLLAKNPEHYAGMFHDVPGTSNTSGQVPARRPLGRSYGRRAASGFAGQSPPPCWDSSWSRRSSVSRRHPALMTT